MKKRAMFWPLLIMSAIFMGISVSLSSCSSSRRIAKSAENAEKYELILSMLENRCYTVNLGYNDTDLRGSGFYYAVNRDSLEIFEPDRDYRTEYTIYPGVGYFQKKPITEYSETITKRGAHKITVVSGNDYYVSSLHITIYPTGRCLLVDINPYFTVSYEGTIDFDDELVH
jgi:hypothetical protein